MTFPRPPPRAPLLDTLGTNPVAITYRNLSDNRELPSRIEVTRIVLRIVLPPPCLALTWFQILRTNYQLPTRVFPDQNVG